MSSATGGMVYVSAILFAIGVCYFWPNMISFVAVYLPETGALGMSVVGGMGMLGLSIFQPIIGRWMDGNREAKALEGFTGDELELMAGQATLQNIAMIPAILIFGFLILYFWQKNKTADVTMAH